MEIKFFTCLMQWNVKFPIGNTISLSYITIRIDLLAHYTKQNRKLDFFNIILSSQ